MGRFGTWSELVAQSSTPRTDSAAATFLQSTVTIHDRVVMCIMIPRASGSRHLSIDDRPAVWLESRTAPACVDN